MSIKFNHRLGTIDVDTTTYDTSSVTSNTNYTINVAVSDAAVVANANSTVDFYYNGTITAKAGGIGGIGCFEITEGDVAGDAGARILYFTDSGDAIKASINSGSNSGDLVIDNNVANKDINLTPSGTGNVGIGNFKFDADQTVGAGQDNYVFTYDNSTGLISLEAATGGGISNVVEDTTPQLGGQLDLNGFNITGALGGDTGATTASITLSNIGTALNAGSYSNWGRNYSSARTFMSNNTYVDPGDAVTDQHRYAVTHASYGHTIYEQAAGAHYWYGDSASVTADTVVTKQLLMDLTEAGVLSVAGVIYPEGQTAGHIQAVTGNYGSIEVDGNEGTTGGWGGVNIGGEFVFMSNQTGVGTTNRGGFFDDINNGWAAQFNTSAANREFVLYYASSTRLATTSTGIDVTSDIALDNDITWADATQPWITMDSTSSGDAWSAQGAGISVGESGKKGSAAIHMTYNGSGYGYFGMGTVDNTASTGGRPAYGHFQMTYNNYNVQVGGRLFPGTNSNTVQSTKYIEATTNYGSINVDGSAGGYAGYSINNDFNFMSNGTTHGIYNAGASEWVMFEVLDNSYTEFRYDNSLAFQTANGDSDAISVWCRVEHNNGSIYDMGMNQMTRFHTNVNLTLDHSDCGGYYYSNNSTNYTITLNNTAAQGASFPTNGLFFVLNYGTGTVSVTGSGVTVYNPHLGTTGNRTIAGNSVATILKYSSTSWFVWGTDVT